MSRPRFVVSGWIAVAVAGLFLGCQAVPNFRQLPPASRSPVVVQAIVQGQILIGMEPNDVEDAWGETDCVFRDQLSGRAVEAWGYGRDASTGRLRGIASCNQTAVIVYFVDGKVAGWALREST